KLKQSEVYFSWSVIRRLTSETEKESSVIFSIKREAIHARCVTRRLKGEIKQKEGEIKQGRGVVHHITSVIISQPGAAHHTRCLINQCESSDRFERGAVPP